MILVNLTDAQVTLVRQALRAEQDRMNAQGFTALANLAAETRDVLANAVLDSKIVLV